jgi:hypothetical protein
MSADQSIVFFEQRVGFGAVRDSGDLLKCADFERLEKHEDFWALGLRGWLVGGMGPKSDKCGNARNVEKSPHQKSREKSEECAGDYPASLIDNGGGKSAASGQVPFTTVPINPHGALLCPQIQTPCETPGWNRSTKRNAAFGRVEE